jgi:hypothetical protein
MLERLGLLSIIMVVALVVSACMDQDPFRLSERSVAGGYRLLQWEDGTYYLVDQDHPDGGGVVEGTVIRIGWNSETILVERRALAAIDKNGLMVIDVNKRTIQGPLPIESADSTPELAGIELVPAAEAWGRLGK